MRVTQINGKERTTIFPARLMTWEFAVSPVIGASFVQLSTTKLLSIMHTRLGNRRSIITYVTKLLIGNGPGRGGGRFSRFSIWAAAGTQPVKRNRGMEITTGWVFNPWTRGPTEMKANSIQGQNVSLGVWVVETLNGSST